MGPTGPFCKCLFSNIMGKQTGSEKPFLVKLVVSPSLYSGGGGGGLSSTEGEFGLDPAD